MTYSIAVFSLSNPATNGQLVGLAATILMLALAAYGFGRVHQYFRQGAERDVAFRDGYNVATKSLFHEAIRIAKGIEAPPPMIDPPTEHVPIRMSHGKAKVTSARHRIEGEEESSYQRTRRGTAWEQFRGK